MSFTPRTTCPDSTSKYYNSNENPLVSSGYGMFQNGGNCTAYAWGRFFEILGTRPKLYTGNAGTWYGYKNDGYERGSSPQLGAVACWSKPGAAGHVAIVEQINSDGSIVISESGWQSLYKYGWIFRTSPQSPPNYYSSGYIFQGFIYNPAVKGMSDKLSEFIKVAKSHVGEDGSWTYKTSGLSVGQPWCAAFVDACAKTVGGLINVVMTGGYGATTYASLGVSSGYGTWIKGPWHGNRAVPQPGDLILFRWDSPRWYNVEYDSDHIGIVESVDATSVYTIEGNSGNRVRNNSYSLSNTRINGYFRPNWSKVSSSVTNLVSYKPLYDMVNTREDAIIREVAYINALNEPSINSSNIRLSMLNYTSSLSAIFNSNVNPSSSDSVITDKLESSPRTVVEYFISKGMNAAIGCGVAANIYHESRFNTASIGDKGTSFGICQWHLGRGDAMKRMAGSNWANNLSGQLDYLYYELTTSEKSTYIALQSVPNTESGARQAADIFVRKFERPANVDYQSTIRQNTASDYWRQLAIQLV